MGEEKKDYCSSTLTAWSSKYYKECYSKILSKKGLGRKKARQKQETGVPLPYIQRVEATAEERSKRNCLSLRITRYASRKGSNSNRK